MPNQALQQTAGAYRLSWVVAAPAPAAAELCRSAAVASNGGGMRRRWWALSVGLAFDGIGGFLLYQFIHDQQCIEWSDYTKVRDGMTQAEVEVVLGPPQSIDATPGGGREVHWIGRKQGMVSVMFNANGTMVRKHYTEDARDYSLSYFPRVRN